MRALSIRQPFAEMILRGMKTVEYRTRPTRVIGERFWIYASLRQAQDWRQLPGKKPITGDNIAVPDKPLPPWMVELAEAMKLWKPGELPTGVIVGSAIIDRCEAVASRQFASPSSPPLTTSNQQLATLYAWHLADVRRIERLRKPTGHPQPVWFKPF